MEPPSKETENFYTEIARNIGITAEVAKVEVIDPELHAEHLGTGCDAVTVHFKDSEPLELFVKRVTKNPEHRKIQKELRIFEKEGAFFKVVLPDLQSVVENRPDPTTPFKFSIAPKCYYADENMIVMENLAKQGYVLWDKSEKHSLDQAKFVLQHLARFHASSFILLSKFESHSEMLHKYPALRDILVHPANEPNVKRFWTPAFVLALNLVKKVEGTDEDISYAVNLLNELINSGGIGSIRKYFEPESGHVCYVINHGDCWNSNMLFRHDLETNAPVDHIFVDFQLVRAGSPNLDIGYYLFSSVKPEVRRTELMTLLRHYFDHFQADVNCLGGQITFTFDVSDKGLFTKNTSESVEEFVQDYKEKCVPGFVMIGLTFFLWLAAAEGMGGMDNVEGDPVAAIFQAMDAWVEKNPDKANEAALNVLATIKEFRELHHPGDL